MLVIQPATHVAIQEAQLTTMSKGMMRQIIGTSVLYVIPRKISQLTSSTIPATRPAILVAIQER